MKISTKKYVDNQIAWLKELQAAEISAIRRAVDKVEATNMAAVGKVEKTNDQKFEAQNEWRAQFKDQMVTFLSRKEFWAVVITIIVAVAVSYLRK